MRRVFLIPPIAAAIIAGLVFWKLAHPPQGPVPQVMVAVGRPAPLFQLYDQNSQIVRLARYVGRHKLLIVFFDARNGVDQSELLERLRSGFGGIHQTRAVVLAISDRRPAEHRQRDQRGSPFPFPMLSDILDYEVHRRYGAFDVSNNEPREAVFVIDRSGIIRHAHVAPDDPGTAEHWARELAGVR